MCSLLDCLLTAEGKYNKWKGSDVAFVDFYVPELFQLEVYCPENLLTETILRGMEQYPLVKFTNLT